jgi:3-hydroxybutyryl-CoA dehydrogenase
VSQPSLSERLGIAGTGTIAGGLARLAAPLGGAIVWARSPDSAARAREAIGDGAVVTTDVSDLAACTFVVEAVVEDPAVKRHLLHRLGRVVPKETLLASTTSSLSVSELAESSGRADRFAAIHVFNPVEKMDLVELSFHPRARAETHERTRALCEALGKTTVEVPDVPGFVVNRLLFPYLFSAVRLMDRHGMRAEDVDSCMKLGAGHPMGPLRLLDFVGLDVAAAIGESIGAEVPERIRELIASGALGQKTGAGFYSYD